MAGFDESPVELSQLLVSKGLVSNEQITRALEYQCRLPPGKYMSLSEVLVSFEYLTPEQIRDVQGHEVDFRDDPVCQVLLKEGIISEEQLTQAMTVLNSFSKSHIGTILADLGMASHQDIERAISQYQLEQSGMQLQQGLKGLSKTSESPTNKPTDKNDSQLNGLETPPQVPTQKIHMPLGRILIAKGWVIESEIEDALNYQSHLPEVLYKPIGEILITLGYIQEEQLEEALEEQKKAERPRSIMGNVLVEKEVITQSQLSRALNLQFQQEHAHKKLGQILVEQAFTTRELIEAALTKNYTPPPPVPIEPVKKTKTHRPLGEILVDKGFVSNELLTQALKEQQAMSDDYMPLGDLLILKGQLSEAQLQTALAEQSKFKREPVGQVLIRYGLIEDWQLAHALCLQHQQTGEKKNLGSILVESGYTTQEAIENVLMKHFQSGS